MWPGHQRSFHTLSLKLQLTIFFLPLHFQKTKKTKTCLLLLSLLKTVLSFSIGWREFTKKKTKTLQFDTVRWDQSRWNRKSTYLKCKCFDHESHKNKNQVSLFSSEFVVWQVFKKSALQMWYGLNSASAQQSHSTETLLQLHSLDKFFFTQGKLTLNHSFLCEFQLTFSPIWLKPNGSLTSSYV